MKSFFNRLWAIAAVTLIEASRRKVFLILLLFAGALFSSAAFFPSVNPEGRLRLMEAWSLRAAGLFTAIAALFLAAFSLPSDFDEKRIYLLATKPVHRSTVFLGKYLGFVLMLAIFVSCMGAITVGYIRTVQLFGGEDFPALVAYPRRSADAFRETGTEPSKSRPDGRVIRGPDGSSSLAWQFKELRPSDFPETVRIAARFSLGATNNMYRASGNVLFRIGAIDSDDATIERVFMNTNEEIEVTFPNRLIRDGRPLWIIVRRGDADGVIVADPESIELFEESDLFELNFAKGMVLVFFQALLILSLTMAASTILSAPIAILGGIMLYIMGSIHSFTEDGMRDIDYTLERYESGKSRSRPEDLPPWALETSVFVSRIVLDIVPDFDNFDFSRWLLQDRSVAWGDLVRAAAQCTPHILVLLIIGMIIMLFRSFT